jgi:hypothetical protein
MVGWIAAIYAVYVSAGLSLTGARGSLLSPVVIPIAYEAGVVCPE